MCANQPSKAPSAFMEPVLLSEQLQAIVGPGPMPRSQVTKLLWEYIKKNRLQNPDNKRQILPDEKLSLVLGTSAPTDMFKMSALISKHMKRPTT